jgi:predicted NUDIX family NTP pyrophosphohydrolase
MKFSAGIICYKFVNNQLNVFLAHSTNVFPFWSFPKGELEEGENKLDAACREFEEETGTTLRTRNRQYYKYLGQVQQNPNKMVCAYGINMDVDPEECFSNECEYPIGSGLMIKEIDDYKWVDIDEAYDIINPKQIPILDALVSSF